jgi:chemotaxis protein methyltransferase CheR
MIREKNQEEREFDFTANDFARVRKLIYQHAGISLSEAKTDMVYSRVGRRLRALDYGSFKAYLDDLESQKNPENGKRLRMR